MTSRVTVSYPADIGDWERDQLRTDHVRAYLKRSNDHAREGDTWPVSVNVGCSGTSPEIPLRVESVDGSDALEESTELAFVEREIDAEREAATQN
ncbi:MULTISPECIES: hypothetical protein [Halobacterium]|uniref:hypothetical protein n=1 Tax=Halobacterium TaxID=2239 RepID=UPI00073E9425|nr:MULTISPECIES: hypothetical protein [Halobacterium]MCG1004089.1 hypothetical protein [Halobacterium noricense]